MRPAKYVINKNSKCPELDLTANGMKLTKEMIENFEVSVSSEEESSSSSELEIDENELMNIQKNFTASFEKSKKFSQEKNIIEAEEKIKPVQQKIVEAEKKVEPVEEKIEENKIPTWGKGLFTEPPKKFSFSPKPNDKFKIDDLARRGEKRTSEYPVKSIDRMSEYPVKSTDRLSEYPVKSTDRLSVYPVKKLSKSKVEYKKFNQSSSETVKPVKSKIDDLTNRVEKFSVEPKKGRLQFKRDFYQNENTQRAMRMKTFKRFLTDELKIKNEMQYFEDEKFNFLKFITAFPDYKKIISRLHNKIRLFQMQTVQHKIQNTVYENIKPVDVTVNIIEGIFVQTKEIKAKQDIDSIFRSELNKVTWDNIHIIIENILKLKVPNQEMMTRLASILYEKCISEELYIKVYAQILSQMQFVFAYQGEFEPSVLEKRSNRTFFFRKITTFCIDSIKNLRSWICDTRGLNEKESEELITEKYRIRTKVLLSIELLCLLYMENSISQKGINKVVSLISSLQSEEDVESACFLLDKIGQYAIENNDIGIIDAIKKLIVQLKNFHTGNMRIEILINQTMENLQGQEKKQNKVSEKIKYEVEIPENIFKKFAPVEKINDTVELLEGDFEEMDYWEDEDYAEGYAEKLNKFGEEALFIATLIVIVKGDCKKSVYKKYLDNFKNIKKDILSIFDKYILLIKIDFPLAGERFSEVKQLFN